MMKSHAKKISDGKTDKSLNGLLYDSNILKRFLKKIISPCHKSCLSMLKIDFASWGPLKVFCSYGEGREGGFLVYCAQLPISYTTFYLNFKSTNFKYNRPFSKMAAKNLNKSKLKTNTSTRKSTLTLVTLPSFSISGEISA